MMMQRGLFTLIGGLAGYALFGSYAAFGFAAIIVNLLTPLPAAFVGMRCGAVTACTTVVFTFLLVLAMHGQPQSLMYLVQFGIPGAMLPWLLNKGVAWDKATVIVVWAMVAASLAGLLVFSAVAGDSPLALTQGLINKEIDQTKVMMQDMFVNADLPSDQRREVTQAVESMSGFLQKAYPGIVITVGGLMTLGLVLLLSLLARGRYTVPGRAFPEWKSPEPMVWILILAGFTVAFAKGLIATFALNILVILLPVYFLQGLAVVDCFFRRKAFSPVIRTIGYLLVTLVNPLPILVTGVGVFDLWADFRKPREPES